MIGDTPLDIACARVDGVRCVAVATGEYTVAELAAADLTVSDAFELRTALAELGVGAASQLASRDQLPPGRVTPNRSKTAIATNAIPVNRSVRMRGMKWAAVRPI